MTGLDWVVMLGTLLGIVAYGAWRSRGVRDVSTFVRGDGSLRWPTIGLSIMATQASAITFISTPGQGYADGMQFVQFYFGLPLAMIVISAVFVPAYFRLGVRTAYEYLEHRFDVRVRVLGGALFLIGRGLAAGITIFAPAIILSQILEWPLQLTIFAIGALVVLYTVTGGNQAVSITQKQQMIVMLGGLVIAAVIVVWRLPREVSLGEAVHVAGALDRMKVIDWKLDPTDRYNVWSGLTGGFFLALSYFGTDQSQVSRYLSGRSVAESRLGLLFNGMLKIPMQFLILFTGVMVFVFYLFVRPPVHFDAPTLARAAAVAPAEAAAVEARHAAAFEAQRGAALGFIEARGTAAEPSARAALTAAAREAAAARGDAKRLIERAVPGAKTRDTDFVFLSFILDFIPIGVVGLLLAVILCAAMSSVAGELLALGATTSVDFYLRLRQARGRPPASAHHGLRASQIATVAWGAIAIAFASTASLFDNLIQAVNILGSIFYGTILGIFVVAFFLRWIGGTAVLIGAIAAQGLVVALFFLSNVGYLWQNPIGCGTVVVVAALAQLVLPRRPPAPAAAAPPR